MIMQCGAECGSASSSAAVTTSRAHIVSSSQIFFPQLLQITDHYIGKNDSAFLALIWLRWMIVLAIYVFE